MARSKTTAIAVLYTATAIPHGFDDAGNPAGGFTVRQAGEEITSDDNLPAAFIDDLLARGAAGMPGADQPAAEVEAPTVSDAG